MNKYAVFGIGIGGFAGVIIGAGVLIWKGFAKIEARLGDINDDIQGLEVALFPQEHEFNEPPKEDEPEVKYKVVHGVDQKPDVDEIAGRYKWEEPDEEPEDDDIL